jgi:arylsulfatase A-like enzyme
MPLTHPPHDPTPDPEHPGQKRPAGLKSNVEYLDFLTGKLVRAIDDMGSKENTILIWVGDNGTAGDGKGTLTELGVRVPLLVRCPGTVKAGVVSRELTDVTDILPTLAEFAGADIPAGHKIDGVSLASTLRGETKEHRPWTFSFLQNGRILRDKRWLMADEGNGTVRFQDCGESRDGAGYKNVSGSKDPDVATARKRFEDILKNLPNAEGHPGLKLPNGEGGKQKKPSGKKAKRAAASDE